MWPFKKSVKESDSKTGKIRYLYSWQLEGF